MNLEEWFSELMDKIKQAGDNNVSFELHLSKTQVQEISKAYDEIEWIEIY